MRCGVELSSSAADDAGALALHQRVALLALIAAVIVLVLLILRADAAFLIAAQHLSSLARDLLANGCRLVIDGALLAGLAGLATFVEVARRRADDALPFDQMRLLSWADAGGGLRIGDGSVLAVALAGGGVELCGRSAKRFGWGCFVLEVDGED